MPAHPPRVRRDCAIRLEDWEQIHRLEAAHFPNPQGFDDWSRLWLENPLWPRLGDRWPMGWLLEDADRRVVGSLLNIPTAYHFQGRELINAVGRGWAVDQAYRGYALWLLDEYYNQLGADLFVNNTINQAAEGAHCAYANQVPLGQWDTIPFWITGYRLFSREVLHKLSMPLPGIAAVPAAACLWVRDAVRGSRLPAPAEGISIEQVSQFDTRFDVFWRDLIRQNPGVLLAARDVQTLTWHYAVPQRRGRLWVYAATRNHRMLAYCVLKRQDDNTGIPRMRLVDYQTLEPDVDFLPGILRAALDRCAAENLCALDVLGTGLRRLGTFDRCALIVTSAHTGPFGITPPIPPLPPRSAARRHGIRHPMMETPASIDTILGKGVARAEPGRPLAGREGRVCDTATPFA